MTLDEVARDPSVAPHLTPEIRATLLAQALAVLGALAAPGIATNGSAPSHQADGDDRWLNDEDAAAMLGVTKRWLRRHGATLPFRRRLSSKMIRFSEAGLRRWQARQRPLT